MKKSLLLVSMLFFILNTSAQVTSFLFEGKDAFETFTNLKYSQTKKFVSKRMPSVNVQKLIEEDKKNDGLGVPFRFGYEMDANYSLNDGSWEEINGKRVWNMLVSSPGAYSLHFLFSELFLSRDAELYIFNPDGLMVYGPVTAEENIMSGGFLTDLVAGDEVIIQLSEPVSSIEKSRLKISKVIHAYINMFPELVKSNNPSLRADLSCHNDVACYPAWETQSDGVTHILMGGATCSGALLNNTRQDFKPYVLTAFHCIDRGEGTDDGDGVLSTQEKNNPANWAFRFHYKRENCSGNIISTYITYSQANFRAAWVNTDFTLVELRTTRTTDRLTFLGWDRTGNTPQTGTGIHHPSSDPMKISFDYDRLASNSTKLEWTKGPDSPVNTHWNVGYDNGTAEGGSSGSPLFDQVKRVVGQLHGGLRNCPPVTKHYGQFHRSWTGGGTNDTRLSNWLDPAGTGATTMNAIRRPGHISGPTLVLNAGSTYSLTSAAGSPQNVTWSCSSNLQIVSSNRTSVTVKPLRDGSAWVRANVDGYITNNYAVFSGKPVITSITKPESAYVGQYATFRAQYDLLSAPRNFQWILNPASGGNVYGGTPSCDIAFYQEGSFQVVVRATNANGTGEYCTSGIRVLGSNGYSYQFYPNPVSDVLIIDLEPQGVQSQQNDANIKQISSFDIRLYNGQGSIVRQSSGVEKKVEFNVSNLPNGMYYLHIFDGTKESPKKHQIIIKH